MTDSSHVSNASYIDIVANKPWSVLFTTARIDQENAYSYLFVDPVSVVSCNLFTGIKIAFATIEDWLSRGFWAAGFVSYECAYHFLELEIPKHLVVEKPLLWFGIYKTANIDDHKNPNRETNRSQFSSKYKHGIKVSQSRDHYGDQLNLGQFKELNKELNNNVRDNKLNTAEINYGPFSKRPCQNPQRKNKKKEDHCQAEFRSDLLVKYLARNFNEDSASFKKKIDAIRDSICKGHTYQINFTGKLSLNSRINGQEDKFDFCSENTAKIFYRLLFNQSCSYASYVNLGDRHILSLSPELFFKRNGLNIMVKPMKGTAKRALTSNADSHQKSRLSRDVKTRAENGMIVDLMRNDLGKICSFGSIRTLDVFKVERYPSLFQMTTTVKGKLLPNRNNYDIFAALFPCGSVTGAPKKSSVEIISALEKEARGAYCGSIGFFGPQQQALFNVAIRTVNLIKPNAKNKKKKSATLGLGSGIVYDSKCQDEYEETLLKARFCFLKREQDFQLIETIFWSAKGFRLLAAHLFRLKQSARFFNFYFPFHRIKNFLNYKAKTFDASQSYKVRLLLFANGKMSIEAEPYVWIASGFHRICFSDHRTNASDTMLYHKTSNRKIYDWQWQQAKNSGYEDVLFFNQDGELTEGAISNVFLEIDGRLITPAVNCGLLNGIYRQKILRENRNILEGRISRDMILRAQVIYLSNALRGFYQVTYRER